MDKIIIANFAATKQSAYNLWKILGYSKKS